MDCTVDTPSVDLIARRTCCFADEFLSNHGLRHTLLLRSVCPILPDSWFPTAARGPERLRCYCTHSAAPFQVPLPLLSTVHLQGLIPVCEQNCWPCTSASACVNCGPAPMPSSRPSLCLSEHSCTPESVSAESLLQKLSLRGWLQSTPVTSALSYACDGL